MSASFLMQARDSVTGVLFTWLSGLADFAGTGYPGPNSPQDIAIQARQVDQTGGGGGSGAVDYKDSARAATTGNIALTGTQTIDGVALGVSQRCLVKDQTLGEENGLYTVSAGAWARTADANTDSLVTSMMIVPVEPGGTANGELRFQLTTLDPITLGTTPLVFEVFAGAAGWASTLSVSRFSGAFNPRIDTGQFLDFQSEVDVRRQTVSYLSSDATQLIAPTGVRFTSVQANIGQTFNSIDTGVVSLGLRADNPTLATAILNQRSPAIVLRGSGWYSNTAAPFQVLWGFAVRPTITTDVIKELGGLTIRREEGGVSGQDVARFDIVSGDPYFSLLGSSSQGAQSGRGLRTWNDFQITTRDGANLNDVRIFEFNSALLGADDVVFSYRKGGSAGFGVIADIDGTPVNRFAIDDSILGYFSQDGTVPIAQFDDGDIIFSGVDSLWAGVFAFDPPTGPLGETITLDFEGASVGLSAVTETDSTAILQQYSRYIGWAGAQWDTDAAASSFNEWGFQLRADSHDHTALPDPFGRLVLRANHRDITQFDIWQIRHETDINDIGHTYLEPTPGDGNFILEILGRTGVSAGTDGRELRAGGGAGLTSGDGGQFFVFGGESPSGTEGAVQAIKHHAIDQTIDQSNEVAFGVRNLAAATAGVQQYSPYLLWGASAFDTDLVLTRPTTWAAQLRVASFDSSVFEDFGRLVFRGSSGPVLQEDLLEFVAVRNSNVVSTLIRNAGDTQGSVAYRGMDAISAATDAGAGVLQGGVATTTGRGGLALVTGGPSPSGNQGDAQVEGFNVLLQSFATVFQGMVGGFVIDEATTLPTGNPTSSPEQIFEYVDPADGLKKYLDSGGTTHTM